VYEPLLERIQTLERSVRRWRLVSLALAILLICCLATGGVFGTLMLFGESRVQQMRMMELERAEVERMRAEQALRNAEVARQRLEQMKKQAEPKAPDGVDP
jgi:hypothetical protein